MAELIPLDGGINKVTFGKAIEPIALEGLLANPTYVEKFWLV